MAWYEKHSPTPFDNMPIWGLWFLDGDLMAKLARRTWTEGQAYPIVTFPSGEQFDIWEGAKSPIIHIFGEMDLPLHSTRDEAFERANHIAEQVGYIARRRGEDRLEVIGYYGEEHFIVVYDNASRTMIDIQKPLQRVEPPKHELLPAEIAEKLPPLYANEDKGWDAVVQVKFFTPDANWTWYATEFDGQDIFYGLVVGFAVELGYFSLKELESVRGGLGLPVERDRHFEPKTLRELKEQHEP